MQTIYLRVRYPIDRIMAVILLVALSPLLLALAVAIVVTSGRPVLFLQRRVGKDGQPFIILKFRTMVRNAETIGGGYMPEGSNLVTPFGRFLRKSSLDELPQLVNIVRGEMAIVGPRPALIDQYRRYTEFQRRRVEVLPGVTGLAQVTYRNDAPWSVRIVLDVRYVDTASPLTDISVLIQTARKVVGGSGILVGQARDEVDDLADGPAE